MKLNLLELTLIVTLLTLFGCGIDEQQNKPGTTNVVFAYQQVPLSSDEVIAPVKPQSITGTISMSVTENNTMSYNLVINGLAINDTLTSAFIKRGFPGGDFNLDPILILADTFTDFSGNVLTKTIRTADTELIETLRNPSLNVYIQVFSAKYPQGLVRGQLTEGGLAFNKIINLLPTPEAAADGRLDTAVLQLSLSAQSRQLFFYYQSDTLTTPNDTLQKIQLRLQPLRDTFLITLADSNSFLVDTSTNKSVAFGEIDLNETQANRLLQDSVFAIITSEAYRSKGLMLGRLK